MGSCDSHCGDNPDAHERKRPKNHKNKYRQRLIKMNMSTTRVQGEEALSDATDITDHDGDGVTISDSESWGADDENNEAESYLDGDSDPDTMEMHDSANEWEGRDATFEVMSAMSAFTKEQQQKQQQLRQIQEHQQHKLPKLPEAKIATI